MRRLNHECIKPGGYIHFKTGQPVPVGPVLALVLGYLETQGHAKSAIAADRACLQEQQRQWTLERETKEEIIKIEKTEKEREREKERRRERERKREIEKAIMQRERDREREINTECEGADKK